MISIYSGPVGSGKSYDAMTKVLDYVYGKRQRYVVANFPLKYSTNKKRLKLEKERFNFWEAITPERLIAFSIEKGLYGHEGKALLVIDEAGIFFNSRDWQVDAHLRKNWVNFESLSRKCGYDIILVSQTDKMIDRMIRDHAEFEVKHFRMNNYWYLKWLPIKLHCRVTHWYHVKGIKGKLEPFTIMSWICNKYDTMRLFNFEDLQKAIMDMYKDKKVIPAPILAFLDAMRMKYSLEKKECDKLKYLIEDDLKNNVIDTDTLKIDVRNSLNENSKIVKMML